MPESNVSRVEFEREELWYQVQRTERILITITFALIVLLWAALNGLLWVVLYSNADTTWPHIIFVVATAVMGYLTYVFVQGGLRRHRNLLEDFATIRYRQEQ